MWNFAERSRSMGREGGNQRRRGKGEKGKSARGDSNKKRPRTRNRMKSRGSVIAKGGRKTMPLPNREAGKEKKERTWGNPDRIGRKRKGGRRAGFNALIPFQEKERAGLVSEKACTMGWDTEIGLRGVRGVSKNT